MKIIKAPIVTYRRTVEFLVVEINGEEFNVYYYSDDNGAETTIFERGKDGRDLCEVADEEICNRVDFIFDEVRQWKDLEDGEEIDEEEYQELKEEYGY